MCSGDVYFLLLMYFKKKKNQYLQLLIVIVTFNLLHLQWCLNLLQTLSSVENKMKKILH